MSKIETLISQSLDLIDRYEVRGVDGFEKEFDTDRNFIDLIEPLILQINSISDLFQYTSQVIPVLNKYFGPQTERDVLPILIPTMLQKYFEFNPITEHYLSESVKLFDYFIFKTKKTDNQNEDEKSD